MLNRYLQYLIYLSISFTCTTAFVPHPTVASGGDTSNSITHTEITELAFIRTFARYIYDTRIRSNNNNGQTITEEQFITTEYTIDDLCKLAYPTYSQAEVELYCLPLKFTLDFIMTYNAWTDFDSFTKKLSAAHYDSEAFVNGSRRMLQLKQTIVNDTRDPTKELTNTRMLLGQSCHTLQDFYSHSNWIEMGKTVINDLIGRSENIGAVAAPNQATCIDNGCVLIEKKCTFLQLVTIQTCPLKYYNCTNNIVPDINSQQLLTSGYASEQHNENNQPVVKPANVKKCSHGSVMEPSSQTSPVGGINKDSESFVYSPHAYLHFQAIDLAVKATEQYLNNLRAEIGNANFERLFAINPSQAEAQAASNRVAKGERFRFFAPRLQASLSQSNSIITQAKNWINKRISMIKSFLMGLFSDKEKLNVPTYNINDLGVDPSKDVNNPHAAPYILEGTTVGRKKRLIKMLRNQQ